jgi:hypothetical protein
MATTRAIVGLYRPPEDAAEAARRVWANLSAVVPYFREKYLNGQRNVRFYSGQQWTREEEALIREQFRYPYVFNEVFQKIDHLLGTFIQTRMDVKFLPREKQWGMAADIYNKVYKLVEHLNDFERIERDVFQDILVWGVGWFRVSWGIRDLPCGVPIIERVPPEDMLWDLNAVERNLSDAAWMARVAWYTRQSASEMFPEHAEVIENIPHKLGAWGVDIGNEPLNLPYFPGSYSGGLSTSMDNFLMHLVPVVEYYERYVGKQWVVVDRIAGEEVSFDDYKEAESYWRGKADGYADNGEVLYDERGQSMLYMVEVRSDRFVQYICIGNQVVHREEVDIPAFPFVPIFAYFYSGHYWSVVDNLVDPQLFVNRMLSEWDYQLGVAAKNPVTVVPTLLRRGYTLEELRSELSRRSPLIPVTDHKAVVFHASQRPQPELFQGVEFGIMRMNEYMGGRNMLGMKEYAGESGRAVIARSEQAGIARLPLFENMRIAKKILAEQVVWYLKNYGDWEVLLQYIDFDVLTAKSINMDTGVTDTLRELKLEIVVDEAVHSATQQERAFMLLKEYFATVGAPPEIAMPMLLKYSPISEEDRREILNMLEFYQEYIQRKAEMARQAKVQSDAKQQVEKALIRHQLAQQVGLQTRPQRLTAEEYLDPQRYRTLPEMEALTRAAARAEGINNSGEMQ